MLINDLSNQQAVVYNDLIMEFNEVFTEYNSIKGSNMRLGQAFFNHFYGTIFHGSYSELFYCEDNEKATRMIEVCLCNYIMEMETS